MTPTLLVARQRRLPGQPTIPLPYINASPPPVLPPQSLPSPPQALPSSHLHHDPSPSLQASTPESPQATLPRRCAQAVSNESQKSRWAGSIYMPIVCCHMRGIYISDSLAKFSQVASRMTSKWTPMGWAISM